MTYYYDVQVYMAGGAGYVTVCRCLDHVGAAHVIGVLLAHTTGAPVQVMPVQAPDDQATPRPPGWMDSAQGEKPPF